LKDLEDQVLLAKAACARDFQGARNAAQFGNILFFQFSYGHDSPARRDVFEEIAGGGRAPEEYRNKQG
jgi:hypothetical protein